MTIVMVIHQPRFSLFSLFDEVLLLGKGGRTVYMGEPLKAISYFQSLGFEVPRDENPADWLMDVTSGSVSNSMVPDFRAPMLFNMWHQHISDRSSAKLTCKRLMTKSLVNPVQLSHELIEQRIGEEWVKINKNGENSMDSDAFCELLANCVGSGGSDFDCQAKALFTAIAKDAGSVNQDAIIDFFDAVSQGNSMLDREKKMDENIAWADSSSIKNFQKLFTPRAEMVKCSELQRRLPNFRQQFSTILHRRAVQISRNHRRRAMDLFLMFATACAMAAQQIDETHSAPNVLMSHLGLGLLSAVSSLRCFGADRPLFWREASHQLNILAYFLAKQCVDSFDVLLQCMVYLVTFFIIAMPPIPFEYYAVPGFLLSFVSSSWGYFISTIVPPQSSQLAVVVTMLVLLGILGDPGKAADFIDGGVMEFIVAFSPTRWTVSMFTLQYYKVRDILASEGLEVAVLYRSSSLDQGVGFRDLSDRVHQASTVCEGDINDHWGDAAVILVLESCLLRVMALLSLKFRNRDKMA